MKDHSGKGILTTLTKHVLAAAPKHGYEYAIAECTGPATQHLYRKLGFKFEFEQEYASFEYQGDFPFKYIQQAPSIQLLVKKIK